jgi:aryl-alcohol dehydrogenase
MLGSDRRSEIPDLRCAVTKMIGAVLRAHGGEFEIEELELAEPNADEVLVKLTATGFCHTDEKVRQGARNVPTPVVLGHEGAGVVVKTGDLTTLSPEDHVVLTFAYCGNCPACETGHPAYCEQMDELNFGATGTAITAANGKLIRGAFFGQSSFATYAIVNERSAVRVEKDLPLEILAPLGCSIQTGVGSILNVLKPDEHSTLAVWGVGTVGLSAVIAATWTYTEQIVVLDTNPERLELAKELGATHAIQVTPDRSALRELNTFYPSGVSHAFDTTGSSEVLHDAVQSLAIRGSAAFVGGARSGDEVSLEINQLLAGRSLQGAVQGDSDPQQLIPFLVNKIRHLHLPIQRLITEYPLAQINEAAKDAAAGKTIKPVLVMPETSAV